ncbi:hypothetical protein C1H76_5683 [Elsinoe australis]|uniref:Uncharacterized protein n=1 Tax=Elsinoe australis TaxID=40998 RepID=A0A4U7AZE3_9PEZI|nr:hypothetical protein C1H76_5683 [Elsinoe australis]
MVRPCLPNSNIIEQNQRVMLPNRSRANIELQTSLPPPLSASSLPLLASPMVIFTKRTRPKTTADVQLNMTETLVPPKGPLARNQILAILDTYNSDSTIDQAKHNLKLGYCPCMVLRWFHEENNILPGHAGNMCRIKDTYRKNLDPVTGGWVQSSGRLSSEGGGETGSGLSHAK